MTGQIQNQSEPNCPPMWNDTMCTCEVHLLVNIKYAYFSINMLDYSPEMQKLRPHPRKTESESTLQQDSLLLFLGLFKFEKTRWKGSLGWMFFSFWYYGWGNWGTDKLGPYNSIRARNRNTCILISLNICQNIALSMLLQKYFLLIIYLFLPPDIS